MLQTLWVALALALAGTDRDGDGDNPSLKEARASLRAASQHKREANGLEGAARYEILDAVVKEYEAAAEQFAAHAEAAAEAWFRAGEIHRTLRRVEEAQRCFLSGSRITDCPGFAVRAVLELGHLERRTDRWDAALDRYEEVEQRFPDQARACADARTWQGKALLSLGRAEEGHRRLLSLRQDFAAFPVHDIRNVDDVAMDWIESGRIEESRRLVDDCVAYHEKYRASDDVATQKLAREIERALSKMKARVALSGDVP